MKKTMLGILMMAAAGSALGAVPSERMNRKNLLIGAYCLQANARTEAHVKAIHDCGVDFIIGVSHSDRPTLDLFAKYGVGAIVGGLMPGWWGGDGDRAGQMKTVNPPEKYAAAAAAYKDHPAIWAVDIGDEPSALDFPYYGDVVRQLNKALPGVPLYLNLYPNYASVSQNSAKQTVNQLGTPTYLEHIEAYCRDVPLDYISYDFYPYTGPQAGDRFLQKCYDNFIIVANACRKTKRSFWYIPQVNSREGLPPTSLNRLRFQAYAAMSFGAEAITWACWCAGWWTNNVIDKAGNPTPQYAKLQTMNAELKRLGPAYMKYRSVATHFVGFPENSPRNPLQPCPKAAQLTTGGVTNLHAADGSPLLVGVMEPRAASAKGARAFFVTAAGDPRDDKPGTVEVCFVPAPKAKVSVQGGQGPIPVKRLEKGMYTFPLPTCAGALVEIK